MDLAEDRLSRRVSPVFRLATNDLGAEVMFD
jgi:hypothetical protein